MRKNEGENSALFLCRYLDEGVSWYRSQSANHHRHQGCKEEGPRLLQHLTIDKLEPERIYVLALI